MATTSCHSHNNGRNIIPCLAVLLIMLTANFALASTTFHGQAAGQKSPGSKSSSSSSSVIKSSRFTHHNEANNQNQLFRRLFMNYVKEAVPSSPVVVHFDVLLIKLKQSAEKEGIFEVVVALFIGWKDKRLMWNPSEYGNLTLLTFNADQVWLPDIAMTNSADHPYAISRDCRFLVRVANDGDLKFVPSGTARTWCDFTLLAFPFDFQTCTLEFESWSMNSSMMTFDWDSRLRLDSQFSSTEWSLCRYKAWTYEHTYQFSKETFTRVHFQYVMKRKSMFYVINLIFPCVILSLIQLLLFWISSTDTTADRVGFGTTNLLTLVVFQTIVTSEMPKTSDAVTALSKYIIALVTLSTVGICESVIVERMTSTVLRPPPKVLVRLLKFVPVLWREKPDTIQQPSRSYDSFEELKVTQRQSSCNGNTRRAAALGRRGMMPSERSRNALTTLATSNGPSYSDYTNVSRFIDASKSDVEEDTAKPVSRVAMVPPLTTRTCSAENNIKFAECTTFITSPSASHQILPKCSLSQQEFPSSNCHSPRGVTRSSSNFMNNKANKAKIRSKKQGKQAYVPPTPQQMEETLLMETGNSLLWMEVAFRIDFITFIFCAFMAAGIPISLFVPLAYTSEICSDNTKDFDVD